MQRFNIRVYGICLNERNEVLLSDESYRNLNFTKFPGGGLEFGEGMIDCLNREFQEEFNLAIEVGELFYLTDFFQVSAFSDKDQVISVYYLIQANLDSLDELVRNQSSEEKLHWVNLSKLKEDLLTFPIDKIVVKQIINYQ
ncbi:NUDIX hydrolase [Fluviicola taffensis]|uniref:NUDIX hydrolase n=1 Tax=Fluviicola taffensis (strain DSM 16823 / NCIMB 13979 / RW262) TaxID=755732 RepID=F2IBJ9_FLUTR|nr:NUDIX hydrolase [Fluviicola taffensis]AEA44307.1 NUDIX hydrolase [Fluviicola taffensis DSM 16823]